MTLHCDRPDSVLHVINLFKELREIAHQRLTTTVEEDRRAQVITGRQSSFLWPCAYMRTRLLLRSCFQHSASAAKPLSSLISIFRRSKFESQTCLQEHFEDVKLREEKAMSEQQQLQQKLKLDRIQWQKQAHLARAQEDALVTNLSAMRTSHAATLHQLRSDSQSLQKAFNDDYEQCAPQFILNCSSARTCLHTSSPFSQQRTQCAGPCRTQGQHGPRRAAELSFFGLAWS